VLGIWGSWCGPGLRALRAKDSYERSRRLDDVLKDCRGTQHASSACDAPRKVSVLADEGVEARQVLVEPEDVRDRLRERGARLRTDGPLNRLDVQLFAAGRDAHGAGAARHRQRRLECPCGELDAIRWQLCDSVRDDRAREIDWLAASAVEGKVSDASQRVEYRELQVVELPRTKEWALLRVGGGAANKHTRERVPPVRFGC
jgi:hypothetical protein